MSDFVAEYSSILYYIKNRILLSFIERESGVPLTYDQVTGHYLAQSVMQPDPVDKYRGWVYFNEINGLPDKTQEQTNRVTVYRQGNIVIPSSQYTVNYLLGGITYSGPSGASNIPKTVDYYWNYVALTDHWPGDDMSELPIIALDVLNTSKVPYQLGSGRKNERLATIEVFASSTQELRELTEVLFDGFYEKTLVVSDFNNKDYGYPLNYDGTFNTKFINIQPQPDYNSCMNFLNVKATRIGLPVGRNDLNRFRSRITFLVCSYEERFAIP